MPSGDRAGNDAHMGEIERLGARIAELETVERRYRAIAEGLPHGAIFITGPDMRYIAVSGQGLEEAGLRGEELTGLRPSDVFPPEVHEIAEAHTRRALEGESSFYEVQFRGRYYENRAVPVRDSNGTVREAIVLVRDITERRLSEERNRENEARFREAQKLESLGVLAGGIAHDFNNILMTVLGNADLALGALSEVSPAREYLLAIEEASRRAADLCRQMLAYSGKGKLVVEPVSLSKLVEEMARILQVSVSKRAVLKCQLDPDLPAVRGDATQLRQIAMNLITNASEAIEKESGTIVVTTGVLECSREYLQEAMLLGDIEPGRYCYFEVTDTGCGMDEETRRRIFEPFYSTKFMGRGLGMAAVLGIVRGHGGAVKVYSEPGRGTSIKVLLPAAEGEKASLRDNTRPDRLDWRGSGTVLLVEDEETVRNVCRRMLGHLGFDVLTASDGAQALDIYRAGRTKIRCVLLDLTMPHMDGEEAFRELRHIDPDVRVVLSSGYNEHEIGQRFAGKGLCGFIQKPYQLNILSQVLRKALEDGSES